MQQCVNALQRAIHRSIYESERKVRINYAGILSLSLCTAALYLSLTHTCTHMLEVYRPQVGEAERRHVDVKQWSTRASYKVLKMGSFSVSCTLSSRCREFINCRLLFIMCTFSSPELRGLIEKQPPQTPTCCCDSKWLALCSFGGWRGLSQKCTHKWKLKTVRAVRMRRKWAVL